jgi:hypothetical protein
MNIFDYNKTMTHVNINLDKLNPRQALLAVLINRLPSIIIASGTITALIVYITK